MLARGVSGTHLTASHKGGFDERPGESICFYLMRTDRDKCTIVVLEAHTLVLSTRRTGTLLQV